MQPSAWFGVGRFVPALVVALALISGPTTNAATYPCSPPMTIIHTNYHNWPDAIVMSNGKIEVTIVPEIGRIMQFRFVGAKQGSFWNNRKLDGHSVDSQSAEWLNFGGDKAWPSPEAKWLEFRGGWRPPAAFDSMPVQAVTGRGTVTLISPVDPYYGIRTRRRITLVPGKPVMQIRTTYEKIQGPPRCAGVWVITQVRNPVGIYIPLPLHSIFPNGCNNQGSALPPSLRVDNRLLSLTRDPKNAYKIGSDAGAVLWVGKKTALLIKSPRVQRGEYPDHGSSAEVYTNPDALPYVELELLGPLHTMKVGDRIRRTSTYTLFHRTARSPQAEARQILAQ